MADNDTQANGSPPKPAARRRPARSAGPKARAASSDAKSRSRRETVDVAFALGGLAGNNGHGAALLQAALDVGAKPDLISCTSGQIRWVHRYVQRCGARPRPAESLKDLLLEEIHEVEPTKLGWLDDVILMLKSTAMLNSEEVKARLATVEWPANVVANIGAALARITQNAMDDPMALFAAHRELLQLKPAQTMVPLFEDAFLEEVSDVFKAADIGIMFNAYNVRTGEEYVYLNDRARDVLGVQYGDKKQDSGRVCYQPITPEAVRQGLWLYEYGFADGVDVIDGAYYRQVILGELARAKTIFVARPINRRWIGALPTDEKALLDLKTEVNFNGAYHRERDTIDLVNRMLQKRQIEKQAVDQEGYHEVKVVEIEMTTQESFFDYLREDVGVFDNAYTRAIKQLKEWRDGRTSS